MKRLLPAAVVLGLGALVLALIAPESPGGVAIGAAKCSRGTVKAVISGRTACLSAGKKCTRKADAQYMPYGFHCRNGRLSKRNPVITSAGPDQIVYDAGQDQCAAGDWPDGGVRAFRDASGQVQVIMPSIYGNRRLIGPDLNHLTHDCTVTLDSNQNPDPAAYDNGQWLASVYSPDGQTVYGLTHMEYIGAFFPGMCPVDIHSPDALRCWWNTVTLVVSTDAGHSYHRAPKRNGLVGALPFRYDPSGIGFEGMGLNGLTQIVRNPDDGYYYTISGDAIAPQAGVQGTGYNCLMRTKNLADPTSWRGWDGRGFTRTFVDPYRESTNPPSAHVCKPINITNHSNNLSLSWNTTLRRWLVVYQNPGGGYWFTTSPDLTSWGRPQKFLDRPNPWGVKCGDPTAESGTSLIDPASTSRNFTTTGQRPYFYTTVYTLSWPTCGTRQFANVSLARIPLRVRYSK